MKIKNTIIKIFASLFFQSFFEKMHYISLKGMNYGSANSPNQSGEVGLINLLKNELEQNPVVFDVGANNGQYLEILLDKFKHLNPIIHSFEPDKKAFERLKSKFADQKNVFLNQFALGEVEKKSLLYYSKSGGVDSSLINDNSTDLISTEIQVKTLDSYCEEHQISKIDFLKIDVEGFERNVLLGSSKKISENSISRIQIEHGSIQSIIAGSSLYLFTKMLPNFDLFHIKQNGIRKLKYEPKNEIYYNSNYYFKLK